jgi:FixJ family two-component response regulator
MGRAHPIRYRDAVSKKPPLIAVVDDDAFVRKALERLIGSAGLSVESFGSGAEFLRSADDHQPDCVVLDLHMADMSGFEVQSRLARAHPCVPVVVITGHDTPESRSRSLGGGAKSYLCKPIDDETLLKAIDAAIVH